MKYKKLNLALLSCSALFSLAVNAADSRYIIQVENANKGIVKALAKQSGGNVNLEANGFISVTFNGKSLADVKGLMNNPHVQLVEEDQRRKLLSFSDSAGDPMAVQVTPYAVVQSNADTLSFNGASAVKVCVIDSGLDRSNNDFIWENISGDDDSGTGSWMSHGGPHGTHVAGTIGAQNNNFGVVGMAPGVKMHIIKVFNADGWGYSSDLAHAAELCQGAGSNIISMSLGGGGANKTEEDAFKAFTDNGGLVIAAAGNDGNSVRSYPAGYDSVMMVGANDADGNIADFSQFPDCGKGRRQNENTCVEVTAGGVNTLSTYPAGLAVNASLSIFTDSDLGIESSAMENQGNASASTFLMGTAEAIDMGAAGKICIIDRGNISFHDKVLNCENSDGIGAIIINNEPGMLYATLGDANATTIPAVGVAQEDKALVESAGTATLDISGADYGFMSGTSMATPAVSGIAALIWSNLPDGHTCTGTDIRDALKQTASNNGVRGDNYFGYGIVNAAAALATANLFEGCGSAEEPEEPEEPEVCRGGPRKCPNK